MQATRGPEVQALRGVEALEVRWETGLLFRSCLHTLTSRLLALRLQAHLLEGAPEDELRTLLPGIFSVLTRAEHCIGGARSLLELRPAGPPSAGALAAAWEELARQHPQVAAPAPGAVPSVAALPFGEADWRMMLGQLVDNALEAGATRIDVTAVAGPGGALEVRVCDDGPGFEADGGRMPREPFVTSKSGHEGLGLARVARLLSHAGGHLRLSTTDGGGAVVELLAGA